MTWPSKHHCSFFCEGFFLFFPSSLRLRLGWEDEQELKPERNHMVPCLLPVGVTSSVASPRQLVDSATSIRDVNRHPSM